MRYITEFEISVHAVHNAGEMNRAIEYRKKANGCELGNLIVDVVGFEDKNIPPEQGKRYAMEVEVFNMKDWRKFKETLKSYIESTQGLLSTINLIMVGKMLKELENIGIEKTQTQKEPNGN